MGRPSFTKERRPRRNSSEASTFKEFSKSRKDSGRESNRRGNRNRRDFQMTKVICSSCHNECEVPFKPTSNKPIYCDECFNKKNKKNDYSNSNKISENDIDIINEKLNKIMTALKIK